MRTKNYFPQSSVIHMWAHQQKDSAMCEGSNHFKIYFQGKTIYSYGDHFPIATLFGKKNEFVAFTTRSYSNTTAGHISTVRGAISHFSKENVILCSDPLDATLGRHENNLQNFETKASIQHSHIAKAKKPEMYFRAIEDLKQDFDKYCKAFKVKTKIKDFPYLNTVMSAEVIAQAKLSEEKEKQTRLKKEQLGRKQENISIKGWKDFDPLYPKLYGLKYNEETFLRFKNNKIETSKGIEMSVSAAKRFYNILSELRDSGGCEGNCKNVKILDYAVQSVNNTHIKIGCHNISWTEILNIAKQAKWI